MTARLDELSQRVGAGRQGSEGQEPTALTCWQEEGEQNSANEAGKRQTEREEEN